jgi:hypothetical protein
MRYFSENVGWKMTIRNIAAALCISAAFMGFAYANPYTEEQLVVIKALTIVTIAEQNCPGVHLNASAIRLVLGKAHLDPNGSAFLAEMEKAGKEIIAGTNDDSVALCKAVKDDSLPFRAMVHVDQ